MRLLHGLAALAALLMSMPALAQSSWDFTFPKAGSTIIRSELLGDLISIPVGGAFPLAEGTRYVGEVELVFSEGGSRRVVSKMEVFPAEDLRPGKVPRHLVIWFEYGMIDPAVETLVVRRANPASDCEQGDARRLYCGMGLLAK